MRSSIQNRAPFSSGLSFEKPEWEVPSANSLDLLQEFLAQISYLEPIALYVHGTLSTNTIGYLKIILKEKASLFVKIIPDGFKRQLLFSCHLDRYMNNAFCNHRYETIQFASIDGKYYALLYQYNLYEYYDLFEYGVDPVVDALDQIHAELASYPDGSRVKRYCDAKLMRLSRKNYDLLLHQQIPARFKDIVLRDLESFDEINKKIFRSPNRQPIHCDLNVGNLVRFSQQPVFLDFEEASRSYLPPIFDVAKIIERFVLVREDIDDNAKEQIFQQLFQH